MLYLKRLEKEEQSPELVDGRKQQRLHQKSMKQRAKKTKMKPRAGSLKR